MWTRSHKGPAATGREREMACQAVLCVGVLAGAVLASGCNPIGEPTYQETSLKPKYQTRSNEDAVVVNAADLGVSASDMAAEGERVLELGRSMGRFPAGLAVVRVGAAMNERNASRHLHVVPNPAHRGVYWSQSMQDLPPVREVTMLRTYGHDPRGTDWRNLLRSSVIFGCDLCMIYAQVGDTTADAEFIGVLWDASTEKALATFRVPVVLPEDVREEYEDDDGFSLLMAEASFRAESDLRRLVRDTLWDLVEKDSPVTTTQPSPWRTDLPLFPRDYHRHRKIIEIFKERRRP